MAKTCTGLAFVLLTLYCQQVFAQSLSLTGRVRDDTGRALPGVSVRLRSLDSIRTAETVTDPAGQYKLSTGESGVHELRFSLVNFRPLTRQITVAPGQATVADAVLPVAFTEDVTVTGRRSFRNLALVEFPAESLIGLAGAASEGAVTAKQLQNRPLRRPGEVLETVPGLAISQHGGEGKANQYYLRGFNLDHGTDFAVSAAYYSPRRWLTFDADLSWTSATFTDDDPSGSAIPGAVRHIASVGASMNEFRRFSGGLRLRYLGPRPLIENASVESRHSFVVNMEAGCRVAPRTRLVIDALNLLDSRSSDVDYYYVSRLPSEPVEGIGDIHTHPVRPRTARISVQFDF
jgi:hypothetical protein